MTTSTEDRPPRPAAYGLLIAATLLLAIAGYVGYELYPRFDLPAVEGLTLLALAAGAGIASFFSPCAFPLLVTLLARERDAAPTRAAEETAEEADGDGRRTGRFSARPLLFATALSVGAAVFLLLCGAGIAFGAAALFAEVTFTSAAGRALRIVVGLLLLALGAIQVGLLPEIFRPIDEAVRPLLKAQAQQRRRRPLLGFAMFGFGYLLAGFG